MAISINRLLGKKTQAHIEGQEAADRAHEAALARDSHQSRLQRERDEYLASKELEVGETIDTRRARLTSASDQERHILAMAQDAARAGDTEKRDRLLHSLSEIQDTNRTERTKDLQGYLAQLGRDDTVKRYGLLNPQIANDISIATGTSNEEAERIRAKGISAPILEQANKATEANVRNIGLTERIKNQIEFEEGANSAARFGQRVNESNRPLWAEKARKELQTGIGLLDADDAANEVRERRLRLISPSDDTDDYTRQRALDREKEQDAIDAMRRKREQDKREYEALVEWQKNNPASAVNTFRAADATARAAAARGLGEEAYYNSPGFTTNTVAQQYRFNPRMQQSIPYRSNRPAFYDTPGLGSGLTPTPAVGDDQFSDFDPSKVRFNFNR